MIFVSGTPFRLVCLPQGETDSEPGRRYGSEHRFVMRPNEGRTLQEPIRFHYAGWILRVAKSVQTSCE
jgi:hypothetical protein